MAKKREGERYMKVKYSKLDVEIAEDIVEILAKAHIYATVEKHGRKTKANVLIRGVFNE